MAKKAILVDVARCIGCNMCVEACHESHGNPGTPTEKLSANTFTVVEERGDYFVRKLCMHCEDPSCASVCPVAAFTKTDVGAVVYDPDRCIGCRYCMIACPFDVPRYEWDTAKPFVKKCDMCYDRVRQGEQTACAEACWEDATNFGDRDEMLAEARRRITDEPDVYLDHIYGEHEVGGTSVLILLPKEYESLGLRKLSGTEMPQLTWNVLSQIPSLVLVLGTALSGIWWITNRRDEVSRAEGTPPQKPSKSKKSNESEA